MIVAGASMAFALDVESTWINLQLVGYLLMAGGVATVLIGLAVLFRRRSAVTATPAVDPATPEG